MRWNKLPEGAKVNSSVGGKNYKKKIEFDSGKIEGDKTAAKLVIPGKLPGLNELINAAKENMHSYSQLKKEYQNKIGWYIKQQNIPRFEQIQVKIKYYRPDRMMDIDNISSAGKKLIMDALVEMDIIPDDCWSVVKGFKEDFEVDKENPRTEVVLKEVKN
jgi:Holliday junction resolvase RusA-like endonuclease